jgi:hypothetical protein
MYNSVCCDSCKAAELIYVEKYKVYALLYGPKADIWSADVILYIL